MRILILGGTTEARTLAGRLAGRPDLVVTLSLAGRTATPAAQPTPVRIGGFGGVEGLAKYLLTERIDALIDATHPYAAIISANAARAAVVAGLPLLALRRAVWQPVADDRWTEVNDIPEAARMLGETPRRVFLTHGRKELAPFEAAPHHHYLVRSVDPVVPPLALSHVVYIIARGPFTEADERSLLTAHRIEVLVSKNSGGAVTYSKIAAARALGISVIMLRRPELPAVRSVETIAEAVAWIDHAAAPRADRGE